MVSVNLTFKGNWSFLDSKIYRWLSKEYVVQTSSKIYGLNDYFCLKAKNMRNVAVNTNKNFQFKIYNNENQVEINYRNTPNKTNSKLK